MPTRLITAEQIEAAFASGARSVVAPRGEAVISPAAWSKAQELSVEIVQDPGAATSAPAPAAPSPKGDSGSSERIVDPDGVILVRGRSVRLGKFTGAGQDKQIGLTDLITGRDGSPMTAGIMSWARADSFDWSLDYDEVDLVLEGVLQIHIDGRVLEGLPGDIFYIPKGSKIRFATPSRTRVFYVTYPADWSAAAPERPQK
jgi:ethanolamine utilization protein EutQ (cupin superfamily)